MVIDHTDENVHCPPCDAIVAMRHGKQIFERKLRNQWIIAGVSAMNPVEIVRKTRKIFEITGVIPHPRLIDTALKLDSDYLETILRRARRPDSLKWFFTKNSSSFSKIPC
jgi:hypothetical protein